MNFELNEEQTLLKEMMRSFAQNEIIPAAQTLEEKHEFPKELIRKLADLGVLGMTIPMEYQGNKTDYLSLMIMLEEISRGLPSLAVILSVHCSLFCYAINHYGSEELKRSYLPRAAQGEILGAFSLTEPGAGSDVTRLQTQAVRKGDSYVLNGTKAWVSNGTEAGAFVIFAMTELDSGKKKMSAFVVDKDTAGFRVSKVEEKMGLHASLTAEVVLEDCRVPATALLGEEGKGTSIALHCLDCSRICIAAQSVGLAQRALDEAVKYAQQREAFGQPIAEFQAIQFMLADIATWTEASRLLTYRAACTYDQEQPFSRESAMAKLYASEAANKIAYLALQIHGGYGYSKEFVIEQLYRDARVLSIYEGTSEIQRLVIARSLLKD
ncbi:MAG: acyl-CoA dehydrogenase [Candidatus Aminicenantes bacterium]|nr:acyl-CoA dehydrogenase [Candidatus Aminicenantes bacterium]